MKNGLIGWMLCLCAALTYAQVNTVVREYRYHASEADSKITARRAALQQLQNSVLQESGVTIQSSFQSNQTLQNDRFTETHDAHVVTQAQGVVKTKVIEEHWDGKTFYIKASISVDTSKLSSLKASTESPENNCKATEKQAQRLLLDVKNPQIQTQLIELSMVYPLSGHCYQWQYLVIDKLRELDVSHAAYRDYLFSSFAKVADHEKGQLVFATIKFATTTEKMTKEEFQMVADAAQSMSHKDIIWLTGILMDVTIENLPMDAPPEAHKKNEKRQWVSALDWQLSVLYALAAEGKLGQPESMDYQTLLGEAMEKMITKRGSDFLSYYFYHHENLDFNSNIKLARKLTSYVKRNLGANALEILEIYINDAPVHKKVNSHIIKLLIHINGLDDTPYFKQAVAKIVKSHFEKIQIMTKQASLSQSKREKWTAEYNL